MAVNETWSIKLDAADKAELVELVDQVKANKGVNTLGEALLDIARTANKAYSEAGDETPVSVNVGQIKEHLDAAYELLYVTDRENRMKLAQAQLQHSEEMRKRGESLTRLFDENNDLAEQLAAARNENAKLMEALEEQEAEAAAAAAKAYKIIDELKDSLAYWQKKAEQLAAGSDENGD